MMVCSQATRQTTQHTDQRTKFIGENVNVVFDDSIGFYQARITQTIECVTQTTAVPLEAKVKDESEEESEPDGEQVNLVE